jgi:hypothetical protein
MGVEMRFKLGLIEVKVTDISAEYCLIRILHLFERIEHLNSTKRKDWELVKKSLKIKDLKVKKGA